MGLPRLNLHLNSPDISFVSAVYLIAVMATSMFSLCATVLVLSLHYHDPTVPVPSWITKILLPEHTVKNNIASVDEVNVEDNDENEANIVNYFEMKKLKEHKELSKVAAMQVTLLYGMLMEMKKNGSKDLNPKYHHEWKLVAKRLDRIFLFIFMFVIVLTTIILLSLL